MTGATGPTGSDGLLPWHPELHIGLCSQRAATPADCSGVSGQLSSLLPFDDVHFLRSYFLVSRETPKRPQSFHPMVVDMRRRLLAISRNLQPKPEKIHWQIL